MRGLVAWLTILNCVGALNENGISGVGSGLPLGLATSDGTPDTAHIHCCTVHLSYLPTIKPPERCHYCINMLAVQ